MSETKITVTDSAGAHIKSVVDKEQGIGIRLSIRPSGCSGLAYQLDVIKTVNPEDLQVLITDNLSLYVEQKSLAFVQGSTVDYVQEGINRRLQIVNPNETGSCGCGESFTVN